MSIPTLAQLFALYDTDKGRHHHYERLYEPLLTPLRERARWVLEIGTEDGRSLRVWRDYFPHATVIGYDIAPRVLLVEDRIFSVVGDQGDRDQLTWLPRSLWVQFDLVVDDASHLPAHQAAGLVWLWRYVAPGGIYIIEDVQTRDVLDDFSSLPGCEAHDLRAEGGQTSMVAVFRKV